MLFNEKVNGSNCKPNHGLIKEESFNDDDILMYSTHSEVKSVITERFIKTLKYKIFKKMRAIDSKSDVSYLNKLVYHCNNTYSVIWLWLKKLRWIPKYKMNDWFRITKYRNIFSKAYTENWSREIFIIDSVLKTNS